MKKIFNYIALACAAFTLASCSADDPIPMATTATTDVSSITFDGQSAASQSVAVISDGDWIATAPEWVTVVPNYGKGNQTVTVSVDDNFEEDGSLAAERTGSLIFSVNGTSATVSILQKGDPDKKPAEIKKVSIAEFVAAPENASVFYEITGTVANVKQTYYGNFDLVDETGSVYVYGLYDAPGGKYGIFESKELKEGDKLTIRGTRGSYNGLIEALSSYYVSHTVSLITVEPGASELIPKEGGSFSVKMVSKGETFNVEIAEDSKSWLSIDKIYKQDADTTVVAFLCQPNEAEPRTGTASFTSQSGSNSSTISVTISQDGIVAIMDASIGEFLAAEENDQYYRLQGVIVSDIKSTDIYGNYTIKDASGEVYVYGTLSEKNGESKKFQELVAATGLKKGDVVTIVGRRASFKGTPQVGGAYYESHISVTPVTCKEFLEAEVSSTAWYSLTAKIDEIVKADYGNVYLVDESTTDKVYVYGIYTGLNGESKKFDTLGAAVGDVITINCQRSEFKGSPQAGKGYFVSLTKAE